MTRDKAGQNTQAPAWSMGASGGLNVEKEKDDWVHTDWLIFQRSAQTTGWIVLFGILIWRGQTAYKGGKYVSDTTGVH